MRTGDGTRTCTTERTGGVTAGVVEREVWGEGSGVLLQETVGETDGEGPTGLESPLPPVRGLALLLPGALLPLLLLALAGFAEELPPLPRRWARERRACKSYERKREGCVAVLR